MEFAEEVDRCALMYGAASKAYRVIIGNKAIRQFVKETEDGEEKLELGATSLLDWIKEMRMPRFIEE